MKARPASDQRARAQGVLIFKLLDSAATSLCSRLDARREPLASGMFRGKLSKQALVQGSLILVPGGVLCALRIDEFCGGGFASSPDASASRSFAYPRPLQT